MFDIHSHILNEVDDGSSSIKESIEILYNLSKIGVTDVILTPHYIEYSSYNSPRSNNISKLNLLKQEVKKSNININLYLGNEIYINNNILELIDKGEVSTLNDTNYLLVELPMSGKYENYIEIFKELIEHGYKVILAHPERYISFQEDFEPLIELNRIGVLFQCNIESVIKKYGKGSYKLIKKLAKENMITFLASDIHHIKDDYSYLEKSKKKLSKYYTDKQLEVLLSLNQKKFLL